MSNINAFKQNILVAIPGALLGLAILVSASLPLRWFIFTFATITGLVVLLLFIKDLERLVYSCFVFFLPLQLGKSFFYIPYAGGGHELRINLPEIFFMLMLVLWGIGVIRIQRRGAVIGNKLMTTGAIFLLLSFLSLWRASNISLGLFELVRATIAYAIFLFIALYVDDEEKLNRTIALLVIGMVPQITAGLYQFFFNQDIGLKLFGEMAMSPNLWADEPLVRVGGLMGHPNAFATYLVMTLPLCLVYWTRKHKALVRASSFALFFIGLFTLVATESRGGWAGFGMGAAVAFILFIFNAKKFGIKSAPTLVTAVSFLLIIGLISHGIIKKRLILDDRGSAASRIPMMIDAFKIIQENPLIGIGINNYALAVPAYDVTGVHEEWQATTVHNLFLLIGAESGIFALVAFVMFWLLILSYVYNLLKLRGILTFSLALAFAMSLVGFFIIHLVDPNYRFYPAIQRELWVLAGLVIAANRVVLPAVPRSSYLP